VERAGRTWPRALWPAWWGPLWSEVLHRDLAGRDFPREDLAALLAHYPEVPEGNLESVLHLANGLLTGAGPPSGGLHLDRRGVTISWEGIEVDVRTFLEAAKRKDEDPSRLAAAAVAGIEGDYLAGFEDPGAEAIRNRIRSGLEDLRDALRPYPDILEPSLRVGWAEGPGRLVPLDSDPVRSRPAIRIPMSGSGSP
jgi:hypothetical protein